MTERRLKRVVAGSPMTLKPSARLQRYLGRELIADPNLALIEFVKNAYDAGSRHVRVVFQLTETPTSVTIEDDGIGMNEDSFRFNWLRPGFSEKAAEYRGDGPHVDAVQAAARRAAARKPAGEKGLGRLAAGRLGERMEVWTRPSPADDWLYVEFDWKKFDDMYRSMDEVEIPFAYRKEAPAGAFEAGTLIRIGGLSQTWMGRLPGRPSPGRPRTRLGRLKQDLSFLFRASADKDEAFEIQLDSDHVTERTDVGTITHESSRLDSAHYVYRFCIDALPAEGDDACQLIVKRSVERSPQTAVSTGKPRKADLKSDPGTTIPARQWPGPFTGYFTYTPPPAARRAREIDLAPTGVLLYRDDVLVEPYGLPGNDWLAVEAKKASRQGHAAIQPSTFAGEVTIGRETNPNLVDMSNRLGLLDTDASIAFTRLVRQEFAAFEDLIYQEVLVEGHWKGKEQKKAAERAVHAEQVAHLRLKALAHRAGQPLQAMAFDILGLQSIAGNEDIPTDARDRIREHSNSLEVGLRRIGQVVEQLSTPPSADEAFDPGALADEVAKEVESLAEQHNAQLSIECRTSRTVFASRSLIFEVLVELLTNAIEVPRIVETTGLVQLEISAPADDHIEVRVVDDGIGFGEQSSKVSDFAQLTSTKGRDADGLLNAQNAVVASRGDLFISDTSEGGTTAVLRIPTGAAPVPRRT